MDRNEILQVLEDDYGTSNPLEISELDRWRLYENLKSNIQTTSNPDDYTRQIIIISETLEL